MCFQKLEMQVNPYIRSANNLIISACYEEADKTRTMMVRIHVGDAKIATVICHKCGLHKNIDVTKFKNTHKRLKATCRCGAVFQLTLEFRKHYRKEVRLAGEYFAKKKADKGNMLVEDISGNGIKFVCLRPHKLSKDDIVELKFNLDNSVRTEIQGLVKIIWIDDINIGAEYINPRSFTSKLGFYLQTKRSI